MLQLWTQDCCSKQASGTPPTALCSRAPEKVPCGEVSNQQLHHWCMAFPEGTQASRWGLPDSWMTTNILKDFGDILLKSKQNTFNLNFFHAFMQQTGWYFYLSPLLPNSVAFTVTMKDLHFWKTTTLTSFTLAFKANIWLAKCLPVKQAKLTFYVSKDNKTVLRAQPAMSFFMKLHRKRWLF